MIIVYISVLYGILVSNVLSVCDNGTYGHLCTPCPQNCRDLSCNSESGVCFSGCLTGFYGEFCNKFCPTNCSTCNMQTGDCPSGCSVGYYGEKCNGECPGNCFSKRCNYADGACVDGCRMGFFGLTCSFPCPVNCRYQICTFVNGTCGEGCESGWHGIRCDKPCPAGCPQTCLSDGGICWRCEQGRYGNFCSEACPDNCAEDTCDLKDGHCTDGCTGGHHGLYCNNVCPEQCACVNDLTTKLSVTKVCKTTAKIYELVIAVLLSAAVGSLITYLATRKISQSKQNNKMSMEQTMNTNNSEGEIQMEKFSNSYVNMATTDLTETHAKELYPTQNGPSVLNPASVNNDYEVIPVSQELSNTET